MKISLKFYRTLASLLTLSCVGVYVLKIKLGTNLVNYIGYLLILFCLFTIVYSCFKVSKFDLKLCIHSLNDGVKDLMLFIIFWGLMMSILSRDETSIIYFLGIFSGIAYIVLHLILLMKYVSSNSRIR